MRQPFGHLLCVLLIAASLVAAPLRAAGGLAEASASALNGDSVQLATGPADINVLVFVDTLCPIANRYAPELARLADLHQDEAVHVWMVYPNTQLSVAEIDQHMREYALPGVALIDVEHALVAASQVVMTPESAVFRGKQRLYHGRIDDRFTGYGSRRARARSTELHDALSAARGGTLPAKSSEPFVGAGCFIADFRDSNGHGESHSHAGHGVESKTSADSAGAHGQ